jgi:hypothetical protein
LLPPESAAITELSQQIGVSVATLERWRADALSMPAERAWTAAARLQAVIVTAAMDEAQRNAWCREKGVYPAELQQWKDNATAALSEIPEERVSHGWLRFLGQISWCFKWICLLVDYLLLGLLVNCFNAGQSDP